MPKTNTGVPDRIPLASLLRSAIRWGLVLLLAMPLVVTPQSFYPFVVGKALFARVTIEVLVALWLLLVLHDPSARPHRSPVLVAFALYVLIATLAAVSGMNPAHSFWSDHQRMQGVWDLFHWLALAVVAASVLRSSDEWVSLFDWLLGVVLVVAALALLQGYAGLESTLLSSDGGRRAATLGNPTYLATLLSIAVMLAVGLYARESLVPKRSIRRPERSRASRNRVGSRAGSSILRPWRQLFRVVTALVCIWVLFLAGSRAPILGLVAGALVMGGAARLGVSRAAWRIAVPASAGLLGVVGLVFVVAATGRGAGLVAAERILNPQTRARGLDVRLELVKIGVQSAVDRPILGWGTDNFAPAFDRFAGASFYRFGPSDFDHAHNKPIEEWATKGVVGLAAYGWLWLTLLLAPLRRREDPANEVLGVAVLGALAAYFVGNLFLFDSPVTLLLWTLLVAWVASTQAGTVEAPRGVSAQRPRWLPPRVVMGAAAVASLAVLATTMWAVHWPTYRGARLFRDAMRQSVSVEHRLEFAEASFASFPPMAPLLRRYMFSAVTIQWASLGILDRRLIIEFARRQGEPSMTANPDDARFLAAALPILQAIATTPTELGRLEPYVDRLSRLAPERVATHQILAAQQLEQGNYQEAIRIADRFTSRAPDTETEFRVIREVAARELGTGR